MFQTCLAKLYNPNKSITIHTATQKSNFTDHTRTKIKLADKQLDNTLIYDLPLTTETCL